MADAIRGTIDLMEADASKLTVRSSYNMSSISFNPEEISSEIKEHIPEFEITYHPDFRQAIADSWPQTIDDSVAKKDWDWSYEYDLAKMTEVMLDEIGKKLSEKQLIS